MKATESIWQYVPAEVTDFFSDNPIRLLPPHEQQGLGKSERDILSRPLVPLPAKLSELYPWLGIASNFGFTDEFLPRTVVTGVCLPELRTCSQWDNWIKRGPTLEYVCAIQLAQQVASLYDADLVILIADQQWLRDVNRHGSVYTKNAARLSDSLRHWIASAYPSAKIYRTSRYPVRLHVAELMEEATLYPEHVPRPWGRSSRDFWTQLDFLANVALFAMAARNGNDVLLLLDHDQYRPAIAATQITTGRLAVGFYWPLPSALWTGFGGLRDKFSKARPEWGSLYRHPFIAQMLDHRIAVEELGVECRRMHRSPEGIGWLYHDAESADLEAIALETLREIGIYLSPHLAMPSSREDCMAEVVRRLRELPSRRRRLGS